ncbi:MAG TPA: aminotransferase class IV [Vicinamibacteria bacterium]|nr:aminotransferase class IV [Vicinamibacteria bacterium]
MKIFRWSDGHLEVTGKAESLAEASAALPDGAYTTLRTYGGRRVPRLASHHQRLQESAGRLLEAGILEAAIAFALDATAHAESRLRVTYAPPDLFVAVEPFEPLPEDLYSTGAWCVTVSARREDPHVKDTRFLSTAQRTYAGLPAGAHEGLLVGEDGAILEGLSSNFFAVKDGRLFTEEDRVLPGITRTMVLELAGSVLPRGEGPLRVGELGQATECFLTSVSREVLPVVRVDEVTIGDGRPGPVSRRLLRDYRAAVLTSPPISRSLPRPAG